MWPFSGGYSGLGLPITGCKSTALKIAIVGEGIRGLRSLGAQRSCEPAIFPRASGTSTSIRADSARRLYGRWKARSTRIGRVAAARASYHCNKAGDDGGARTASMPPVRDVRRYRASVWRPRQLLDRKRPCAGERSRAVHGHDIKDARMIHRAGGRGLARAVERRGRDRRATDGDRLHQRQGSDAATCAGSTGEAIVPAARVPAQVAKLAGMVPVYRDDADGAALAADGPRSAGKTASARLSRLTSNTFTDARGPHSIGARAPTISVPHKRTIRTA